MSKKAIVILIIVLILLLLGTGIFFIWKSKPKKGSDKEYYDEPSDVPPGPSSGNVPSGGSSALKDNEFPLKKGMRGTLVMGLQSKIGTTTAYLNALKIEGAAIPEPDGVFGPITEKAVMTCFGTTEVSKQLYESIMTGSNGTPPTPTPPAAVKPNTAIAIGTKLFANSPTGVNAYTSNKASASNVYKFYANGSYIGTYLANDGIFSKVIVAEKDIIWGGTKSKVVWVMTNQIKH